MLGDEVRSPSKTSVISMPSDVQETDAESGMLYVNGV